MKKRKLKFPFKIISIIILSLTVVFLLVFFSHRYLTTSDYFEVKDSVYFSGRNIFKINLRQEAQKMSRVYPDYKKIVLRRVLPDRIVIDFEPRQAVALLRLSDDFYVDREGVLFRLSRQRQSNSQLPLIVGLGARIPNPRSGAKYNEESLQAILEFINHLKEDRVLSEYIKIQQADLTNINDVILFTSAGCKINLGAIGSPDKDLSILRRLVSDIKPDLTTVEYIDLRFREPVVKYK
jgi:cell division septal protein FtsQ